MARRDGSVTPLQRSQTDKRAADIVTDNIKLWSCNYKGTGCDTGKENLIIDCDAYGKCRGTSMLEICPCLTHSRPNGHWITSRGRYTNKAEMLRLQGMDPRLKLGDKPGRFIGNSMSVNVVERLLRRALEAAGLIPINVEDRWRSGFAYRALFQKGPATRVPHGPHSPATVASAMFCQKKRKYIVDSGATYHLVCEEDLTETERAAK